MLDRRKVWGFFESPDAAERIEYLRQNGDCYPLHAVIHPTAACGHSCGFCYHKESMSKRKTPLRSYEIEAGRAEDLILELYGLGTNNIILSGGGEPLKHPDIFRFVKAVNSTGAKSLMYSSLDAHISDNLAGEMAKLGGIGVNIDAVDAATYKSLRGPHADFETVSRNIKNLAAAGAKMYGTIIADGSEKDIQSTVEFCIQNGMTGVNVSPSFGSRADIGKLEEIKAGFPRQPVRVVGPLEKAVEILGKKYCQSHRFDITIGSDHGVYPCCPTAYSEDFMIVNLLDFGSFSEAWNSQQRAKWLSQFEPSCEECWFHPVNKKLAEMME